MPADPPPMITKSFWIMLLGLLLDFFFDEGAARLVIKHLKRRHVIIFGEQANDLRLAETALALAKTSPGPLFEGLDRKARNLSRKDIEDLAKRDFLALADPLAVCRMGLDQGVALGQRHQERIDIGLHALFVALLLFQWKNGADQFGRDVFANRRRRDKARRFDAGHVDEIRVFLRWLDDEIMGRRRGRSEEHT